jgi:hypothetical protein
MLWNRTPRDEMPPSDAMERICQKSRDRRKKIREGGMSTNGL